MRAIFGAWWGRKYHAGYYNTAFTISAATPCFSIFQFDTYAMLLTDIYMFPLFLTL